MTDLIKVEDQRIVLDAEASRLIVALEEKIECLEEVECEVKKRILNEMEGKKIIRVETDALVIDYIAPADHKKFNFKALKGDFVGLYKKYIKSSAPKSSIRITLKKIP